MPRALVHMTLLLALVAVALYQAFPAAPRAPRSPADFDTDRALAHVRAIAKEPHPAGSAANDGVRAYILGELAKLDLKPVVLSRTIRWYGPTPTLTLHNILVRLPGRRAAPVDPPLPTSTADKRHAVLLTAHYDSVSNAPGAADDAAGVAALLEAARALRAGPPVERDVYLLLTDGEEGGLRGARALAGHSARITEPPTAPAGPSDAPPDRPIPLFSHVALVFNFEARGTSGPSVMFETGPAENLALLRHFAAADPSPVATSLAFDVYRLLPNNTDFTVFKKLGLQGLNFSFIGSYHNYHTKADSPENLSTASLHHHGQHALNLARHFANLDGAALAAVLAPDQPGSVFFSPTRAGLIVYPASWVWPLTAIQALLAVTVIVVAARKGQLPGRGVASAVVRFLLSILLSAAAVFGLVTLLKPMGSVDQFHPYLAATWAAATLVSLFVALEFRRTRGSTTRPPSPADGPRRGPEPDGDVPVSRTDNVPFRPTTPAALATVSLVFATLLSIPANLYLPGGSYLLTLPAMSASLALLVTLIVRRPWVRTAGQLLAITPALFIVVPMLYLLNQALLPTKLYYGSDFDPTRFLDTPVIAAGLSVLTVQLVWKLIPALPLCTGAPAKQSQVG